MTSAMTVNGQPRLRTAVASVALAVGLAGCMVGPDYEAPKTELAPFHNLDAC